MKFRLVGDTRDSKDPDVVTKYYVRYDDINAVLKRLSLNKQEADLAREWAEDAKPGDMLTVKSRQTTEMALVVAINDAGSVTKIGEETVKRLVLDKLVDPDDRPRSRAARRGRAKSGDEAQEE